jgi:hypothetical protein
MRVKIANVTEVPHPLFASYAISGIPRMAGVWPHSPETSIDSWLFQKTTIRRLLDRRDGGIHDLISASLGTQSFRWSGIWGGAIFIPMPLQRKCLSCGETRIYANRPGYERASRLNSLCRKCAASPAVVQRQLEEKQESRAAEIPGRNPLAGFFRMLEMERSGSMGRNPI